MTKFSKKCLVLLAIFEVLAFFIFLCIFPEGVFIFLILGILFFALMALMAWVLEWLCK